MYSRDTIPKNHSIHIQCPLPTAARSTHKAPQLEPNSCSRSFSLPRSFSAVQLLPDPAAHAISSPYAFSHTHSGLSLRTLSPTGLGWLPLDQTATEGLVSDAGVLHSGLRPQLPAGSRIRNSLPGQIAAWALDDSAYSSHAPPVPSTALNYISQNTSWSHLCWVKERLNQNS